MRKIFTKLVLLTGGVLAQQHVFEGAAADTKAAIDSGVRMLATKLMHEGHIPGLGLGVVHPDNSVETAVWGIRSEAKDRMSSMTIDVSLFWFP